MVKLDVRIKADLENLTGLVPSETKFRWSFVFKCTQCGEHSPTPQFLEWKHGMGKRPSQGEEILGFSAKCKFCSRENSVSMIKANKSMGSGAETVQPYTNSDKWSRLCSLDCRGIEPVSFHPEGFWIARGLESNSEFNEIEIDAKNGWADYDSNAAVPVGVFDIEFDFVERK